MGKREREAGEGGTGAATVATPRPATAVGNRSPRRYRVLLHNDDYTTMDFVVWVLEHFFRHARREAVRKMLEVHTQGLTIAGVYPREIAETKVGEVTLAAEKQGMPLRVTAEPEPDGGPGEPEA